VLKIVLLVFAIAALGGLVLASHVLRGRLAPWALSVGHALLGASGIVVLVLVAMKGTPAGAVFAALGLFVVAALGGFYLASMHLRGSIAPKGVVALHAGVAVAGFLTLLAAALSA